MACQFMSECPSSSGWCNSPDWDFSRCIPFLINAVQNRDKKIRDLEKASKEQDNYAKKESAPRIFYLCDSRACDKCNPKCCHTTDIRHAKNFRLGVNTIDSSPVFLEEPHE